MKSFNFWRFKAAMILALLYLMPDTFAQDDLDLVHVNVIIARTDTGTQARSTRANVAAMITNLNNAYDDAGIRFDTCSVYFFDDNDYWAGYKTTESNEEDFIEALGDHFKEHVLNIFITGMEGHGHANWPEDFMDLVEIEGEEDYELKSTPIHEVGHYFSLRHTYDTSWGDELVNGDAENRNTTGDLVSDTPASPGGVEGDMDPDDCSYHGDAEDANHDAYAPDGRNYMEDAPADCRNRFSAIQINRIRTALLLDRYYLIHNDCNPPQDVTFHCDDDDITTIDEFPHKERFDRTHATDSWTSDFSLDYGWSWGPSTPSSSTGASSARAGYYFRYLEASDHEGRAGLLSPCYDLENYRHASVTFYYNMYGDDVDTLRLEVTTDNGDTWTNIFERTGEQHSNGDWHDATVSLNNYAGNKIQLRFVGTTDGHSKGDISLDTITVNADNSANESYTIKVDADSDDAEEEVSSGDIDLTSTDLELVDEDDKDTKRQLVGMRFTNITIPQGTNILSAYIQFTVDETSDGDCNLTIQAEDVDSSVTFTSTNKDISNRVKTDASVSWEPESWDNEGDAGTDQKTPDIKNVIQEVVNRNGFASGNPITIIISGSGMRVAESYHGDADAAPVLHITTGPEEEANAVNNTEKDFKVEINPKEDLSKVQLYPNPVKSTLYIKGLQEQSTVYILSVKGAVIKTVKVKNSSTQVNVSDLKTGMYLLRYFDGSSYKVERFIKE